MTLKRFFRMLALVLLIGMASVLPIPIAFVRKDDVPKFLIEQVDKNENEDKDDNIKELF